MTMARDLKGIRISIRNDDGRDLPVKYTRDADGHEIRKHPWVRAIATRSVNRQDVISNRLLAVIVLVQSCDEDLYVCKATLRLQNDLKIARTIKIIRIAKISFCFFVFYILFFTLAIQDDPR